MSNQANAVKMSKDETKRRKTAKTGKNSKKPGKKMNRGPNHRARGMVRWGRAMWHDRAPGPVVRFRNFLFKALFGRFYGGSLGVAQGLAWASLWRFLGQFRLDLS